GSLAALQLCRGGRRHRYADHACPPRRRPYLQHAQATRGVPRTWRVAAHLWARPYDPWPGRQEAFKTTRRDGCRRLSTPRDSPRGDAQLPRASWMEPGRRSRDHEQRGAAQPLFARRHSQEAVRLRYDKARVDEWAVPHREVGGGVVSTRATGAGQARPQWHARFDAARHYRGENTLAHYARCGPAGGGAAGREVPDPGREGPTGNCQGPGRLSCFARRERRCIAERARLDAGESREGVAQSRGAAQRGGG